MAAAPAGIAVYCASSLGNQKAYQLAAVSLGQAIAKSERPLVYGGGSKGLMGLVSGAVLQDGGDVTGIVPYAMIAAGGEGDKGNPGNDSKDVLINERGREKVKTILVNSMHERKVEMAKLVGGFIGLSGGFGTFEEVLEVITWNQLGIHSKPVVLLNVLSFYDPLRALIRTAIREGFIEPENERLVLFVDGPPPADFNSSQSPIDGDAYKKEEDWTKAHEVFDWGKAALDALEEWNKNQAFKSYSFDWTRRAPGSEGKAEDGLAGA